MITRQELEGQWEQIKGRVRERWGQLTDNELQDAHGDLEQLVGVIKQKTGESKRAIDEFLKEIVDDDGSVAHTAREYAERAGGAIKDQYEHISGSLRDGYKQAEGVVRRKPFESVAVTFGVGLITGVVVSLMLKSR